LETAGRIGLTSSADHSLLTDPDARPRYIIRSLMDEAIESSLLEGAVGTRRDARRMLREKREPRNPSERMIANNYSAMQHVKTRLKEPLTIELLHSVHEILMRDMMAEEELGAFRTDYDDVRVEDEGSGEVLHQPPPAAGLEERMQKICDFANADHREDDFIHPIVKAIILHFMIGYEHPYCDGNGRTARAVFYWSALRSGYWLFEFLVISELLRKARTGYRDAYLESERDHGDLTYFIDFNLRKIIEAIGQLEQFLESERLQTDREARISLLDSTLNARQRKLLAAALKHPGDHFTVTSHATTNAITEPTARADLNDLVDKGFMITFKDRQRVVYQLNPKVHTRLDLLISE
jgi:Fic family protein